jgi:hypothetical protein
MVRLAKLTAYNQEWECSDDAYRGTETPARLVGKLGPSKRNYVDNNLTLFQRLGAALH